MVSATGDSVSSGGRCNVGSTWVEATRWPSRSTNGDLERALPLEVLVGEYKRSLSRALDNATKKRHSCSSLSAALMASRLLRPAPSMRPSGGTMVPASELFGER